MNNWIATRALVDGKGQPIEISIGAPESVSAEEWKCPIRIVHAGKEELKYGRGIDAFQSLTLGLEAIRIHVQTIEGAHWDGFPAGDTGFDRIVPRFFGLDFTRKLDRMIDAEVEFFSEMAKSGKFRQQQS